jgi:hypothetical protein
VAFGFSVLDLLLLNKCRAFLSFLVVNLKENFLLKILEILKRKHIKTLKMYFEKLKKKGQKKLE